MRFLELNHYVMMLLECSGLESSKDSGPCQPQSVAPPPTKSMKRPGKLQFLFFQKAPQSSKAKNMKRFRAQRPPLHCGANVLRGAQNASCTDLPHNKPNSVFMPCFLNIPIPLPETVWFRVCKHVAILMFFAFGFMVWDLKAFWVFCCFVVI